MSADTADAADPPGRRRREVSPRKRRRAIVRRVVTVALLAWLVGLWVHQVVDGPGAPVDVGAITAPADPAELGLPTARERSGRLSGVVHTSTGLGASDVLVTLVVGDELFWTSSDALGTFELVGLPSSGRAALCAAPLAAPALSVDLELPAGGPLRLDLPPPFEPLPTLPQVRRSTLTGVVRLPGDGDGNERDPSGYEVWLAPHDQTAAGLREVPAPGLDGRVHRRVEVERDGRFRVGDLAVGAYQARVLPPWARGGSWPVIGTLSLDHARRGGAPVVDVSAGAIDGVVLDEDGEPIAGALVRASDASDPALLLPATRTDAQGRFAIEDAPEGSIRLRVRAGERAAERTLRIAPLRREKVELRLLPVR